MTSSTITSVHRPLFEEFDNMARTLETYLSSKPLYSRSSELTRKVDNNSNPAVIEIEVPGVEPSDIKVKIEGRSLSVETPKGSAYIPIGQRLDAEGTTANLKHGMLTIRIPKRDAKVVSITVHEG